MSLSISSVNIHHAQKLVFDNNSHVDSAWLDIRVLCEETGHERDAISIFYYKDFTSADVERAMVKYLEKSGYEVTKKPVETGAPQ